VAQATRFAAKSREGNPIEFLSSIESEIKGKELRDHFVAMREALLVGVEPHDLAASRIDTSS